MKKKSQTAVSAEQVWGMRTVLLIILMLLVLVFVFIQEPPTSREKEDFKALLRKAGDSIMFLSDSLLRQAKPDSSSSTEPLLPTQTETNADVIFDASGQGSGSFVTSATTYSSIPAITDPVAPQVMILSPVSGEKVAGQVHIVLNVADNMRVSFTEITVDDVVSSSHSEPASSFTWDSRPASNGIHRIRAKVVDVAGNSAEASVYVVVENDHTPPSVSLSDPPAGTYVYGKNVLLTAVASDNSQIERVEFYVDEKLLQTDRVTPFTVSWNSQNVQNGQHSISAQAVDSSGNVSGVAVSIVYVVNPVH